jgi:hypothetical protein
MPRRASGTVSARGRAKRGCEGARVTLRPSDGVELESGEEQDAIVSVSLTRFALDGADESLVRRGFECMRCTKTASSDALNDRHRAGDRGRNGAISAEALVLDHYGLG